MPAIYEWKHVVTVEDLDDLQHANNISYLKWMQSAALDHSAIQGWPADSYRSLGCGWVVRTHHVDYYVPAKLHDEVIVRTWVADMKKVTSLRRFRMHRAFDDMLLATASTDWAFVDYRSGLPKRVPVEIRNAFEVVSDPAGSP